MEPGNRFVSGKEVPPMRCSPPGSFREQVGFLRRQFLQDGDLPFTNVLTEEALEHALAALPRWLWKGRRVHVYDGSSVSMPDTPANQAAYPQPVVQKPGLGFPLARIAAVFSLACGAVLDLGICRYAGKGQSELAHISH